MIGVNHSQVVRLRAFKATLILFGLPVLLFAIWEEIPRWVVGGSEMVAHRSLLPIGYFPLKLTAGARILVLGDSNGTRTKIADADPWPALLVNTLGGGLSLINRSRGGFTAVRMVEMLSEEGVLTVPDSELCILALGTNDAAPRSITKRRQAVAPENYVAALRALTRGCRMTGAQVLILAPISGGSPAIERRVAPYRHYARVAALEMGAWFLDPVAAFDDTGLDEGAVAVLQYDGLHLTAPAHARLARWLAGKIEILPHSA